MSKEVNRGYPNYGCEFPLTTASEGYFYAKREVADALIRRVQAIEEKLESCPENSDELKATAKALEEFRSFVRNFMLWNTERGK
jgi:hypothetical protein